MSPLEYISQAIDGWDRYLALTALSLALHWVLIKRWAVGVYDPMFLLLTSNVFGWSIVWFMFLRGDIATVYVASFTAAQLALYAGIGVGRLFRSSSDPLQPPANDALVPKLTLCVAAVVHIASTLAIWRLAGIPLFRESRLGAFLGSGGFGLVERLAESSAQIALFSAVYLFVQWRHMRRNMAVIAYLLWFLSTVALSGSKGALLSIGQFVLSILFVYGGLRLRTDRYWGGRSGKALILAASLFAVAVLAFQQEGDVGLAGLGLLYRLVNYGDVYIFAYPDATIESLKGSNPLVGMFGGFLSTFRLFPQELLHVSIGYQFTMLIFPDLDQIVGPNPQHPVFGYHYFGMFGFVFSFALGLLTVAVQTRFYFRRHSSFFVGLAAFMTYFALVSVSVDFDYSMSKLANVVIGLVVIVGPVLLLRPRAAIWHRRTRRAPAAAQTAGPA